MSGNCRARPLSLALYLPPSLSLTLIARIRNYWCEQKTCNKNYVNVA